MEIQPFSSSVWRTKCGRQVLLRWVKPLLGQETRSDKNAGLAAPQGDRKQATPGLSRAHEIWLRPADQSNMRIERKIMSHPSVKETNVYRGPVPGLHLTYGWERLPDKPLVRLWSIREYLTDHPDRLAQFFRISEKLPGDKSYYRFVFGYRTFDPRCPDNWRPAVFEVGQSANLCGDVATAWEDAIGDPCKENKLVLNLLRKEAKHRPEAAEALRNLALPDTSELPIKQQIFFGPPI